MISLLCTPFISQQHASYCPFHILFLFGFVFTSCHGITVLDSIQMQGNSLTKHIGSQIVSFKCIQPDVYNILVLNLGLRSSWAIQPLLHSKESHLLFITMKWPAFWAIRSRVHNLRDNLKLKWASKWRKHLMLVARSAIEDRCFVEIVMSSLRPGEATDDLDTCILYEGWRSLGNYRCQTGIVIGEKDLKGSQKLQFFLFFFWVVKQGTKDNTVSKT